MRTFVACSDGIPCKRLRTICSLEANQRKFPMICKTPFLRIEKQQRNWLVKFTNLYVHHMEKCLFVPRKHPNPTTLRNASNSNWSIQHGCFWTPAAAFKQVAHLQFCREHTSLLFELFTLLQKKCYRQCGCTTHADTSTQHLASET